jgi:hypothetical protein
MAYPMHFWKNVARQGKSEAGRGPFYYGAFLLLVLRNTDVHVCIFPYIAMNGLWLRSPAMWRGKMHARASELPEIRSRKAPYKRALSAASDF